MCKSVVFVVVLTLLLLSAVHGFAQDKVSAYDHWNRVDVRIGGFIAFFDSTIRYGVTESVGIHVDVEDALGVDSNLTVYTIDAAWRFSHNRRHRFDASYAAFRRSATRVLEEDLPVGDGVIEAGTQIDSVYNIQVIKFLYSWSFLQDKRLDMGIGGGLYVMPVYVKLAAEGEESKLQDITAPLPVFDFRMAFLVTPKTYFRLRLNAFYLSIDDYTGSITDYSLFYEWRFHKNLGVGAGFESFSMNVEGSGDGTGLWQPSGKIQAAYRGIVLYGKLYF
jgi:hypothetical protein